MNAAVSDARMPSLCSTRIELHARVRALDHERLDRGAALVAVERRPHDDEVGALAGGDVDLLAVEDVLVAVEDGGGADRGRVRARLGLGDRHRGPLAAVALELLVVGDRGDRRVAEALAGHRQQQADVAPAQLHDRQRGREVARRSCVPSACAVGRRRWPPRRAGRARAAGPAALVHALDQGGEHVELLRVRVLLAVVLARDRAGRRCSATWWACPTAARTSSGLRG